MLAKHFCCSCWKKQLTRLGLCIVLSLDWVQMVAQVREMSRTVNAAQMKLVEGEEGDKLELLSLMEVAFSTLS